jgi:hypothetical protein
MSRIGATITAKRRESVPFENQCARCGQTYAGTVVVEGSSTKYVADGDARARAEAGAHNEAQSEAKQVLRFVRCPSCGRRAPLSKIRVFWHSVLVLASFAAPLLWLFVIAAVVRRVRRGRAAARVPVHSSAAAAPEPWTGGTIDRPQVDSFTEYPRLNEEGLGDVRTTWSEVSTLGAYGRVFAFGGVMCATVMYFVTREDHRRPVERDARHSLDTTSQAGPQRSTEPGIPPTLTDGSPAPGDSATSAPIPDDLLVTYSVGACQQDKGRVNIQIDARGPEQSNAVDTVRTSACPSSKHRPSSRGSCGRSSRRASTAWPIKTSTKG